MINTWQKCKTNVFWGEIAPCDHLVQIYESDDIVIDSLEGFVSSGFQAGDSVILIATDAHLFSLNKRLRMLGYNIDYLQATSFFFPLSAEDTLAKFMVNGWPDEVLFQKVVKDLINKARGDNRKVRAYGEMVSILWNQGHTKATVQLEHLWNKFCETEAFCLFCAYPRSGFTEDAADSINHICCAHTKVIAGNNRSTTEVFYRRA
jgi:uncharacterized protein with PIN domain